MPASTIGMPSPAIPSSPPPAMPARKAVGSAQRIAPPEAPAQRPIATIASTWSKPPSGWSSPAEKPCTLPMPVWARAAPGAAISARRAKRVRVAILWFSMMSEPIVP